MRAFATALIVLWASFLAAGCGGAGQRAGAPADMASVGVDRSGPGADGATGRDDAVVATGDAAATSDAAATGDAAATDAHARDHAASSDGGPPPPFDGSGPPSDGGPPAVGVAVQGTQLFRDGNPWLPKGLSMIGALTKGSAVAARAHFGADELAAATTFGADTLRFQVSQPYLDPQDPLHDAAYLGQLMTIVSASLDAGFIVVLSMQDQSLAGGDATPTPTAATQRAWAVLAPAYQNDLRVIFELYNEPNTQATTAGWALWLSGDATQGIVGHQDLLNQLRMLGATNVIFADGAQHAEILPPTAILNDPLNNLVYAAHPYFLGPAGGEVAQWDDRFGNLSASVPVVVSEWNDYSNGSCNVNAPTLVPQLLTYLIAHNIGIYGWAFDLPGTLVQDFTWKPTNYNNYMCNTTGTPGGAGELLSNSFKLQ